MCWDEDRIRKNVWITSFFEIIIQAATGKRDINMCWIGNFCPFRYTIISERIRIDSGNFKHEYVWIKRPRIHRCFQIFSGNRNAKIGFTGQSFRIRHSKDDSIFPWGKLDRYRIFFLTCLSISEIPKICESIFIEIITFFSWDIYTTHIYSMTLNAISLLCFISSESSLWLDMSNRHMILWAGFGLMNLRSSSIGEGKKLLSIIGRISLLKNSKLHDKFADGIIHIPRITLILCPRKIRAPRKVPLTCFFWSKNLVFNIHCTVRLQATIITVQSGLYPYYRIDNSNRGSIWVSSSRAKVWGGGRTSCLTRPRGTTRYRQTVSQCRSMKQDRTFGK